MKLDRHTDRNIVHRSCFAMTEPAVASSDATNIESSIRREGDELVISGRKWWTSGAMDPRTTICVFMGKTDTSAARHRQQSMVLVPFDAPGVHVIRPLRWEDFAPSDKDRMKMSILISVFSDSRTVPVVMPR